MKFDAPFVFASNADFYGENIWRINTERGNNTANKPNRRMILFKGTVIRATKIPATRRATLLRCKLQSQCCSYFHPRYNLSRNKKMLQVEKL